MPEENKRVSFVLMLSEGLSPPWVVKHIGERELAVAAVYVSTAGSRAALELRS